MPGTGPFGHDVAQRQPDQFERGLVRREVAARLDDLPKLHVQRLDRVGRIYNFSDIRREGIERNHLIPGPAPERGNRRVFRTPRARIERVQRHGDRFGARCPIDLLERRRDRFPVFPAGEVQRVPDQMHDTGLDRRFREYRVDRFREALQAVDHGNQDVLHAAQLQVVDHPQPELGPLGLLESKAQHVTCAVATHAQRQVDRLVAHDAFVADLDSQGVEEHDRVHRLERPLLPCKRQSEAVLTIRT